MGTMVTMDFKTRYGKLNAAQKNAVDTIDGPVMVIAGPGTGKTELLSMRAANILARTDTLPENILCLTFTDSGAAAIRQRLTEIIGADAYKIAIHTFHSFGTEVINQNGEFFYHGANFRPADELSSYQLLRDIFDELDYTSPIASKMNGEYTHLRDTLTTISELKKSGLTSDELLAVLDANDKVIDAAEPILSDVFAAKINKQTPDRLAPVIEKLRNIDSVVTIPGISVLSQVLADSLASAVGEATESSSTKPITAWRNSWMKKDDVGKFVFKARDRQTKLRAVSYVYYQYLARMQQAELYDFDDMILRVVHAMEVFDELRLNLQEKYQYIMVDEFQDTNMAQMRILYNLTNNEVSGSQPNIMAVGDDDQAIYSFQGADVGNIHSFRELYEQTRLIVLTDNYRSTEAILDRARSVITLGADRLENRIAELNKKLISHQTSTDTDVRLMELPSTSGERAWIASEIAGLLQKGVSPASIAVLARRHQEIINLLPYLAQEGIKVNYERQDNVLDLDVIVLIEQLAKLLVALSEGQHAEADSVLPRLLAHPAFAIDPTAIWRLSLRAYTNRQRWMELLSATPEFMPFHAWLVTLAQAAVHTPLEQILDDMIGVPKNGGSSQLHKPSKTAPARVTTSGAVPEIVLSARQKISGADSPAEPADNDVQSSAEEVKARSEQKNEVFLSPIYTYYFSPQKLQQAPDSYLTFLEALRTIRNKLREYQPQKTPTLRSFLEFIQLHRDLGSTISAIRSRARLADDAVNVMTAHKSKGLEFEHVYILGATDATWGERARSRSRLIGYPENLPLAPAGDTYDERLRLFFVAMTRAKRKLAISYATADDNGKTALRASFLTDESWHITTPDIPQTIESQVGEAEAQWYQPLVQPIQQSMHDLLAPMLETYKLSATHVNSFLDVSRGGPQHFLIQNLLRFPQAPTPYAGYGIAIHAALQRAHAHLAATGKHRPVEDVLHDFEKSLEEQNLRPDDFRTYLQKGTDSLTTFLSAKYDSFTPHQKTELNFASQNVYLGKACLTGSLDLVEIQDDEVIVTDYKTGRAARNWQGKTDQEKIRLHKYQQQLMFYNLLVARSRDYGRYRFSKGVLQFVEPTPNNEIIALEATFSEGDLERFAQLIQKIWEHVMTLDLPDTSRYQPTYKGMLAFEEDLLENNI